MKKIQKADNNQLNREIVNMSKTARDERMREMKKEWREKEEDIYHSNREFKFVKIHLMLHCHDDGPLPQHSTQKPESTSIKTDSIAETAFKTTLTRFLLNTATSSASICDNSRSKPHTEIIICYKTC